MTNNELRYMHKLEQLSGMLRDSISELETLDERLTEDRNNGIPLQELTCTYTEYMAHSKTKDVVHDLHELALQIRGDAEVENLNSLREDLIVTNTLALRICTLIFEISSMLAGLR